MSASIRFFDSDSEIDVDTHVNADKIVVRPKCIAFRVERIEIERGQDWLVDEILVHDKSQFRKSGSIPGDVFALPPATLNAFVRVPFDTLQTAMDFTMVARYVGSESPAPTFVCKAYGQSAGAISRRSSDEVSLPNQPRDRNEAVR